MEIKSVITERDYINLSFLVFWNRLVVKILAGIMLLSCTYSIIFLIVQRTEFKTANVGTPVICFTVFTLVIYFTAKGNFKTNKRISEEMIYLFEEDYLSIKGESFNSQLTWDKLYKVTETKNWLLIWSNRQIANPILKKNIPASGLIKLKGILNRHQVKNNLK